jgi:Fe-S-cluster containining protein
MSNTTDPLAASADAAPRAANADRALTRQIELGFMFSHSVMSETSRQVIAASTAAFALSELLIEQGLIDRDLFQARLETVRSTLLQQIEQSGLGLFVNEQHQDKYQLTELPQINCAERLHLCHAACCTLRFPLARQDVEEGAVRWDFGRPYWNLVSASGYCTHCDTNGHRCTIYDQRPATCRVYDCREDKRIWQDFEQMIISPELRAFIESMVNDRQASEHDRPSAP